MCCISFSPFMYKMSFRFWSFLKRGSRNDEAGNYNKLVCDYIQRKQDRKRNSKVLIKWLLGYLLSIDSYFQIDFLQFSRSIFWYQYMLCSSENVFISFLSFLLSSFELHMNPIEMLLYTRYSDSNSIFCEIVIGCTFI